jgi:type IV secretion system protein VirB6
MTAGPSRPSTNSATMLQELFQNVDSFGTSFVAQSYQALAATLTGQAGGVDYLSLLLTLYIIFWGVSIWWGSAKGTVTDQVYRLFRVFVIYTLATSWADFQSLVYDFSQELPSAIGNALLVVVSQNATGDAANLNSTDQVQNALQSLWDSAEATANAFFQTGGITNPGPWFIGAVFLVAMALYWLAMPPFSSSWPSSSSGCCSASLRSSLSFTCSPRPQVMSRAGSRSLSTSLWCRS